jgi:hypothetical protein
MPCAYNSCIVSTLCYWNLQIHYWWQLCNLLGSTHFENTEHTTYIVLHSHNSWENDFSISDCVVQCFCWSTVNTEYFLRFWSMSHPPSEGMDCMTLKIQNGWKGEGNYCCEDGITFVSSIFPFLYVFAFKATSCRTEVSLTLRGEKWSHYVVVWTCGRVLWQWNTKTQTQAKQMPWQRWLLCWKIANGMS